VNVRPYRHECGLMALWLASFLPWGYTLYPEAHPWSLFGSGRPSHGRASGVASRGSRAAGLMDSTQMNTKATARRRRRGLLAAILLSGIAAGCAHPTSRLCAAMQPDGWSAQPIGIVSRFAPDADLDPAAQTPVGDEGYRLSILTVAAHWDYRDTMSFLASFAQRPWGHSWIVLESPQHRLEYGLSGNFGRTKLRYHEGVIQRIRDGDPNPIGYLWETMPDGQREIGRSGRTPSFVWRMPITQRRHQRIYEFLMQRKYDRFGIRSDNCTDMVVEAAALAGLHLIHRMRLTLPPEVNLHGRTLRVWTDPKYRILEFSTPDVLEVDLRHLAQFGIGSEATESYLAGKR